MECNLLTCRSHLYSDFPFDQWILEKRGKLCDIHPLCNPWIISHWLAIAIFTTIFDLITVWICHKRGKLWQIHPQAQYILQWFRNSTKKEHKTTTTTTTTTNSLYTLTIHSLGTRLYLYQRHPMFNMKVHSSAVTRELVLFKRKRLWEGFGIK